MASRSPSSLDAGRSSAPALPAPRRRSLSTRAHLIALTAAILLPLVAAASLLLARYAEAEKVRYQQDALALARQLAFGIDRELNGMILALQALAIAPQLRDGDLAGFRALARELLAYRGREIALRDRNGRELVSTRPEASPSPPPATPAPAMPAAVAEADGAVLATGRPYVSDLVTGAPGQEPYLIVDVPVLDGDTVRGTLSSTIAPEHLGAMLARMAPTPDWAASVIDRKDLIAARSRQAERFVGSVATDDLRRIATGREGVWIGSTKDGTAVLAAYARTDHADWRIAVGAPLALAEAPLRHLLLLLLAGAFLVLALSAGLAMWWARRLVRPIRLLAASAAALGQGLPPQPIASTVREINQVGDVLVAAAASLRRHERERDAVEERLRLLLAELDHRVKNTLALVQAMVRQSVGGAPSVEAYRDAILGRLRALAAVHDLLAAANWAGTPAAALVERVLAPYRSATARAEIRVGVTVLPAMLAQDLALTLHELATNAVKYGAWSVPGGTVAVEAGIEQASDAPPALRLCWRETGGPPVTPPARLGYGTTLVTAMLQHAHRGKVSLDWRQEGLVCTLWVPLPAGPAAPSAVEPEAAGSPPRQAS